MIANLMVFYKGAISYKEFQEMPINDLIDLNNFAQKINREQEKEMKKASR